MRVGIFTDNYVSGVSGLATSVNMLYHGIKAAGHECYIFTSHDPNMDFGNPDVVNFPGHPYPLKGLEDYRYAYKATIRNRFVDIVEPYHLDIIHVHTEFSMARLAVLCAKKFDIPLVYTLHTMYEYYLGYISPFFDKLCHKLFWKIIRHRFLNDISKRADLVIVPSQKVVDLKANYGIAHLPIEVIPTGIDLDRFRDIETITPKGLELRKKYHLEDKLIFLYIGRISPEKDLDKTLHSYAAMPSLDNTVFVVVGDGPDLARIRRISEELKLGEHAVFTGMIPQEEIQNYYAMGDVFVSSSRTESQGLTFVESLSAKLPMVALFDETLAELVKDGFNGFLCKDNTEMTARLSEITANPQLRKDFAEHADFGVDRYTKETYAQTVLAQYSKLVDEYRAKKNPG